MTAGAQRVYLEAGLHRECGVVVNALIVDPQSVQQVIDGKLLGKSPLRAVRTALCQLHLHNDPSLSLSADCYTTERAENQRRVHKMFTIIRYNTRDFLQRMLRKVVMKNGADDPHRRNKLEDNTL